jgi:AbrB family looped-hinge helix DNA binding protein
MRDSLSSHARETNPACFRLHQLDAQIPADRVCGARQSLQRYRGKSGTATAYTDSANNEAGSVDFLLCVSHGRNLLPSATLGLASGFSHLMTTKITLDRAGRVLIPKTLREEWRLHPGDTLQLDSQGEEMVTLRPVRARALLKKELGVWVYQGETASASIPALIDREREKRLREMLG